MKSRLVVTLGFGAALAFALAAAAPPSRMQEDLKRAQENTAQTYEHLATAIIELRKTEDGLVKGVVLHSAGIADAALARAARMQGGEKKQALERAAGGITEAAGEGDKAVQAVRQRLSKAGHTHNTDTETKEDYLWIDSKEKKQLLDLAQRVCKMDENVSADDVNKAREDLRAIMEGAMKDD